MEPAAAVAAALADPPMERAVWLACAGPLASLPYIGTQVYYFPRGHADQCRGAHLPNPPLDAALLCTVNSIVMRYHEGTDEPYALIALHPVQQGGPAQGPAPAAQDHEERPALDYFVKHVTGTYVSSPFPVSKASAGELFPELVGDQASQVLPMVDVHGNTYDIRHALNRKGVPTLGAKWNSFSSAKKLHTSMGNDAVVFMRLRLAEDRFLLGLRRGGQPSIGLSMELADNFREAAAERAAAGDRSFTVKYYPRLGWPFVVPRKVVDDALDVDWQTGMNVRMTIPVDAHELEASRLETPPFFPGVVSVVNNNQWCKLQVNWARSPAPPSSVNVWQVEAVDAVEPSSNAPPSSLATGSSDAPPSSSATGSPDAPSASSAPTGSIMLFGKYVKPEVKPE